MDLQVTVESIPEETLPGKKAAGTREETRSQSEAKTEDLSVLQTTVSVSFYNFLKKRTVTSTSLWPLET